MLQSHSWYYIEAITFSFSNKDNHLWNDMITVLSANFAQLRATQAEFWCIWTIKLSQKQIRASEKQNGIRWCQQCNKPGATGEQSVTCSWGYELKTNYVKNTTSVSSCDLEQVTRTKYTNQNMYKRNNANIACQLFHQSRWY